MGERKAAIVTGSATGVGAATALALARRGYDVLINYSKSEREAREAEAACRAAGADTLLVRGDVARRRRLPRPWRSAALERWQRLDALVNNAGITTFAGGGELGCARCRGLPAHLRRQRDRRLPDGAGLRAAPEGERRRRDRQRVVDRRRLGIGSSVPYIASKGAVNSMTLHLARALAPEIRVNAVCPGLITTRWFVDGVGQEGFEKLKANYEQHHAAGARLHAPKTWPTRWCG